MAALRGSVLTAAGATGIELRARVFAGDVAGEPYGDYVAKIRDASYRVTDRDFTLMAEAGLSEDAIWEVTVAAALGSACRGLDAAVAAMSEKG